MECAGFFTKPCVGRISNCFDKEIQRTIDKLKFAAKIANVHCHAVQWQMTLNGLDFAETTIFNGNNSNELLSAKLLIDITKNDLSDDNHWH